MIASGCLGRPFGSGGDSAIPEALRDAWREWPITTTETRLAASAGAPVLAAQRALGGSGDDTAYDIWPVRDGGYVISGSTTSHERSDHDLFVVRVDATGQVVWARVFGGSEIEIGFAVRTLDDDTIVVAGWTRSFGAGKGDFLLLGLSADGGLRFAETYGGAGEERATSMAVTTDGLLLIGETYSHGAGDARFLLVATDHRGVRRYERTYDNGALNERGLAIVAQDGRALLVGNAMDATSGSRATISNGWAVSVGERAGDEHWRLGIDSGDHDIFHHAAPIPGGYLITGYTRGFGAEGENDILLLPVTTEGVARPSILIGGNGADHNIMARSDHLGGVLLAGYTTSFGHGAWDADITRIASDLSVAWRHAWGAGGDDGATSLVPLATGGTAATGYTESFGAGARDILFFVVDSDVE